MRKKTPKAIVAFSTTSDAMAFEVKAKECDLPGRLIPIPSAISAGCGLAWCAPLQDQGELERFLALNKLASEQICHVDLY